MAETRNGYPYPILTDPFNVPADIRNLAEATDVGISTVSESVTELNTVTAPKTITLPSAWRSNSSFHYVTMGNFASLIGWLGLTSPLRAGGHFNLFTLPAEIWPSRDVFMTVPARQEGQTSIESTANIQITAAGQVSLHLPVPATHIYLHSVLYLRVRS